MFVKRIEMHGFKSFAEKTIFALTPGTTVVVGPNGCGKSNITDAVRWVLGEQSARHLRGTRMDDIIFGGTATRKALSFAEVSITLDHTDGALGLDYQEITVTRRIYRNGESEYLLNKRQCRLKDIVDLFMDTGIGREAYSFIGQGRVAEIINARPEERRQIFEEAAGIVKYKSRKREAERRLAETAENLLRVGDIINELSGQVGPLTQQAKSAEQYLSLRSELKSKEVNVLVYDAGLLRTGWYDFDAKVKAAADDLLQQQASIGHRENQLTEKQIALDEEQATVTGMQREAQRLTSELDKIQSRTALTQEKVRGVDRQLAEGTAVLADFDMQMNVMREENNRTLALMTAAKDSLLRAQMELKAAEKDLAALESSPEALEFSARQEELDKLMPELRRNQSDVDRLEIELDQLDDKLAALAVQCQEKTAEIATLVSKKSTLDAEIEKQTLEKKKILHMIVAQKDCQNKLAIKVNDLSTKRATLEQARLETVGRVRLLTELEEAMSGYFQGVKSVLSAKKAGRFPEIYGTVADLVQVPASYVAAIEAAVGPALQNLVAKSDTVAKEAISYLKKEKGGRATFLPLNILDVQPRRLAPTELCTLPGYISVAADVVTVNPEFKPVVESLLGRVHLVKNLEAAVPVAKILRFRERVVTLDGDVILPGGAMTGGFDKKQAGVLSRRKEIEELREALHSKEAELASILGKIQSQSNEQNQLSADLTSLEEEARRLDTELKISDNDARYLASQAAVINAALLTVEKESLSVTGRKNERRETLSTLQTELTKTEEREAELRYQLARLSGVLSAREQEKRSLRERYTESRVRLASLQKQEEHHENELERLKGELFRIAERRRQKVEEMRLQKTARLDLEGTVADTDEQAAALQQERGAMLSVLVERENNLKAMATAFREESEHVRQLEKSLTGLERKQARQEMERSRVEIELQAVLERLRETWELEYSVAEALAKPLADRDKVQVEILALKEKIAALGTVNLGAIEEYQRVTERVDFLTTQRDDLRSGEKDLLRIIREIDGRMGEKFSAAFAVINEHFGVVFKELFGGGRAQLCLTDPESPLDAGIEIAAQPPGKKLQHLTLLSGGEKALTAIALLFSFLKVKPTPFCILDEIEAALDEANLTRFTDYLRTLNKETQFIIISHRKKTMEQADILYGVTMEESGVSKLISVRLREAQANAPSATA